MSPKPFASLRRRWALLGAVAVAAILPLAVIGQAATPAARTAAKDAPETAAIRKLLEQRFPGAPIGGITRTPYFGLYEVQFEDTLVYTDAAVTYVFAGSIYEASTRRNLTEERLRKLARVSWDSLPLDLAMKKVKGNGSRKLVVFSDADCPFCARLENELRNVDNVTIYTFLYPIASLHPDAARKSRVIWCAPDPVAAWDAWFATQKLPNNPGTCATPVEKLQALGEKLRINATPTLVFADGSIVPGAIPAARLEAEFKQADLEAAKLAAEKGGKPAVEKGGKPAVVR